MVTVIRMALHMTRLWPWYSGSKKLDAMPGGGAIAGTVCESIVAVAAMIRGTTVLMGKGRPRDEEEQT